MAHRRSHTIDDVLAVAGNRPVLEQLVSILEARKDSVLRTLYQEGRGGRSGQPPLYLSE